MFKKRIKEFFVWANIKLYLKELFLPKNKSFFQIVWWNIRLMFFFTILKDVAKFLLECYYFYLEFFYKKIFDYLNNPIFKSLKGLQKFFIIIINNIYFIMSFNLFKSIFFYINNIRKEKKWYDSYYWILIDIFRDFYFKLLKYIRYAYNYSIGIYVKKFYKFFFKQIVIGGFFAPVFWFIRYKIFGRFIFRLKSILWYRWKIITNIYFVQKKGLGFFYISEFEPFKWWGFDEFLEHSFKKVLSGTELDMDKKWVWLYRWLFQRYILFNFFKYFRYFFYFMLFFFVIINYLLLFIKLSWNFIKILYSKSLKGRWSRRIKIKYLFFKYKF